jgi:uncharacterized membrane protein (UPF0127 family)
MVNFIHRLSWRQIPMSRLYLGALALVVVASLGLGARAGSPRFEKSALTIDTVAGPQHFAVELARTPEEQELGLMFRPSLAPNAGMLFDFGETRPAIFWMKNTLIPLDMLFITADGRVADIHERAVPLSEATIQSRVPVRAVLEINGSEAAQLGIRLGDVVHHAIFGNAPQAQSNSTPK